MIAPGQALIRSGALAAELGVSPQTVSKWAKERAEFRAARWTRGVFKVQTLRDAGLLPRPESVAAAS